MIISLIVAMDRRGVIGVNGHITLALVRRLETFQGNHHGQAHYHGQEDS